MPHNPQVSLADDAGFPIYPTATAPVAAAAGVVVVKAQPGRLAQVVVTASGTGVVTFYDNASAASGTVLFVVPASAPVGTTYTVNMPAVNGITANAAASSSAVTVLYA